MSKELRSLLARRWLHSHEEETPTERVYRPEAFPFPPSRGRSGFELHPDGSAERIGIGGDDRREVLPAHWELGEGTPARLRISGAGGDVTELSILSAEPDRLTVRK